MRFHDRTAGVAARNRPPEDYDAGLVAARFYPVFGAAASVSLKGGS